MSMINVSMVGNLVRAPEQVSFASGRVKTTFQLAVNHGARKSGEAAEGGDGTGFYRVETWGKLADLASKYLVKGNQVGVTGRLILEHWTDREGRERITPLVSAAQISLPPRSAQKPVDNSDSSDAGSAEALRSQESLLGQSRLVTIDS